MAQAQAPKLHGGRRHGKGFAAAHHMAQQGIAAVEDAGHGVFLMGPQLDLRVHAVELDVGAIVFPGPDGVEFLIVALHQLLPALRVFPYPALESVLDGLLLLLGDDGFLLVQQPGFLPVYGDGIQHPHIPQVQAFFQDFICVDPMGAVFQDGIVVIEVRAFPGYAPHGGIGGKQHLDLVSPVRGGVEQAIHECFHHLWGNPGGAQAHFDIPGLQILWLHSLEGQDLGLKGLQGFRLRLGRMPG